MEEHKRLKPYFSQAADRLDDRICKLIGTAAEKIQCQSVMPIEEEEQAAKTINVSSIDGGGSLEGTTDLVRTQLDTSETPKS